MLQLTDGICFFDVAGVWLDTISSSRQDGVEDGGRNGAPHQPPKASVARRRNDEGFQPSGTVRGVLALRMSRAHLTAERMPRRTRGATAPPIGSRVAPQPSTATGAPRGPRRALLPQSAMSQDLLDLPAGRQVTSVWWRSMNAMIYSERGPTRKPV